MTEWRGMNSGVTPRDRVGWLLRVHRVLNGSGRLRTLAGLAAALSDTAGAVGRIDPSTVSRWEFGKVAVSRSVLRSYEAVFQLPEDSLVTAVSTVRRYWSPRLAAGVESARDDPEWRSERLLDDLLDRVGADDELTGHEWDALTGILSAKPEIYLRPRDWTGLADRLLREMLIADRGRYLRRREAFQRMMVHPRAETAAVGASVAAGDDVTGQVFIEAISALDSSAHPDAGRAIVRQLEHPTNSGAQLGALQATVRKLRYGHFSPAQRRRILDVAQSLWHGGESDTDLVRLVIELTQRDHSLADQAVSGGADERQAAVVSRITASASVAAGVPESFSDPILPRLVFELIFSPSADVRLVASSMVAASPYRPGLARAVGSELTMPGVVNDQVDWADRLLDTLRLIGDAGQLPLVQRLAIADGVPAPTARAAAISLGHVGGESDRTYWSKAFGKYATLWRRHRRTSHADQLSALVYSVGTLGEVDMLRIVHGDPALPAQTRVAAAWWLNLPGFITRGAQR